MSKVMHSKSQRCLPTGRFGTATMSYFQFIRWLLFLNIFMSVVMVCVVLLPHFLINVPPTFGDSVNVSMSIFHKEAVECTDVYNSATDEIIRSEDVFHQVFDFLQGTVSTVTYLDYT